MWWHADLPVALHPAPAPETPPEPDAQGEFLLEWILPGLAEEARSHRLWRDSSDGGDRRALRRELRDEDR
jgi:hypothetical protein